MSRWPRPRPGIAGLEFLSGIPGTIGGGLRMNAGAYGREIKDVLVAATAIDRRGAYHVIDAPRRWAFPTAIAASIPDWIFIAARAARRGRRPASDRPADGRDPGGARGHAADPRPHRRLDLRQPAGRQGLAADRRRRLPRPRRGGAMVSTKHANFLINTGGATAADIEGLGEEVRRRVHEHVRHRARMGNPPHRPSAAGIEPIAAGAAAMSKRVAVLMGGWSPEREVSLSSGRECAKALADRGYRVTAIDVGARPAGAAARRSIRAPMRSSTRCTAVGGEDGTIQAVLEMLRIPYTHSGVLASALAMHKPTAKTRLRRRRPAGRRGMSSAAAEELARGDPMPAPFVVKPVNEGSSVGVRIVRAGDNAWREEVAGWRLRRARSWSSAMSPAARSPSR